MDQQFVVPQFIDVENKIFGPVSVRQFIILLVGGILIFLAYSFADFVLFIILTLLIGGTSLMFAFVKIKGQKFHIFILNLFQYIKKDRMRIWDKRYTKDELEFLRKQYTHREIEQERERQQAKKSKIRDLSLVVNTGGYYEGQKSAGGSSSGLQDEFELD